MHPPVVTFDVTAALTIHRGIANQPGGLFTLGDRHRQIPQDIRKHWQAKSCRSIWRLTFDLTRNIPILLFRKNIGPEIKMLGTIVNTMAIIAGSLVGFIFSRFIPKKNADSLIQAVAFAIILIGLKMAWKTDAFIIVICSLSFGTIIGELIRIEERVNNLGNWLEERFAKSGSRISKGFVTTSLLYCVGSMAIVGALESGLTGNHDTLFAKSVLDGLGSIIFTASMGIGVLFSAASVFLYQGLITVSASFMKQFLTPEVITQMSAVGGLLIVAMGFNMLVMVKIKVGNCLPAIFIPLVYFIFKQLFALLY